MTTSQDKQVITYEQVLADLREIVDEKGADYVYNFREPSQCVYFDPSDGTPSCIVGHWLARHNVSLWDEGDGWYTEINLGTNATSLLDRDYNYVPVDVDADGALLLEYVQSYQDGGIPWGMALSMAVSRLEDGESLPPEDPWAEQA